MIERKESALHHFCGLTRQYLVKFPAKFNIDNEKKIWCFEKNGNLKRQAFLTTLTVLISLISKLVIRSEMIVTVAGPTVTPTYLFYQPLVTKLRSVLGRQEILQLRINY